MLPLANTTSDHVPCVVQIGTNISKAKVFCFETHWVDHPGFMEVVESTWNMEVNTSNSATKIAGKFKNLWKTLKRWGLGLSRLKARIKTCNETLIIVDKLEENMPLNTPER
jgi:hypothetical protein